MALKKLRILNYPWHAGHQYELHKLPHEFTLVVRPGVPEWKFKHRPLHPRVPVLPESAVDVDSFDAAILHFDHHVLDPWLGGETQPFLYFKERLKIPHVAICHGTPPRDENGKVIEEKRQQIVDCVGDTLVICNSHTAREGWGFQNAITVWHGFDPMEYPSASSTGGPDRAVLTVANFHESIRHYQGYDVFRPVSEAVPCDVLWSRGAREGFRVAQAREWPAILQRLAMGVFTSKKNTCPELSPAWVRWVGNPYARVRFREYRRLIRRYAVYFNPTLYSPMPRSRAEGMMSGLAIVTTHHHDEDRWLENEVDGFYSNDAKKLTEYLRYLLDNPSEAREIGRRGQARAREIFSLARFHSEWERILKDLIV